MARWRRGPDGAGRRGPRPGGRPTAAGSHTAAHPRPLDALDTHTNVNIKYLCLMGELDWDLACDGCHTMSL